MIGEVRDLRRTIEGAMRFENIKAELPLRAWALAELELRETK